MTPARIPPRPPMCQQGRWVLLAAAAVRMVVPLLLLLVLRGTRQVWAAHAPSAWPAAHCMVPWLAASYAGKAMQGTVHFGANADHCCCAGGMPQCTAMLQEQRRGLLCQTTGAAHESTAQNTALRFRITAVLKQMNHCQWPFRVPCVA